MPFFVRLILSISSSPITGILERTFVTYFFRSRYPSPVRIPFKYRDIPPTFSEMDMLLSFNIMMRFFFMRAALFSAS